jgi:hypothetical protein
VVAQSAGGVAALLAGRRGRVIDAIENAGRRYAFAEATLAGEEPLWHWGSLVRLGGGVYCAGRYFTTTDRRHPDSALSRLIIEGEEDPDAVERIAEMISGLAETAWKGTNVDLITSVPPSPGEDCDRFESIRIALAKATGVRQSGEVLTQLRGDDDYKHHGQRNGSSEHGTGSARPLCRGSACCCWTT